MQPLHQFRGASLPLTDSLTLVGKAEVLRTANREYLALCIVRESVESNLDVILAAVCSSPVTILVGHAQSGARRHDAGQTATRLLEKDTVTCLDVRINA